jgi:hypothetical protein
LTVYNVAAGIVPGKFCPIGLDALFGLGRKVQSYKQLAEVTPLVCFLLS